MNHEGALDHYLFFSCWGKTFMHTLQEPCVTGKLQEAELINQPFFCVFKGWLLYLNYNHWAESLPLAPPRGLHIPAIMTQSFSIVCWISDTLCESPAELWSDLQGLSFYDVLYPWQCLGIHQMDPCLSPPPFSAVSQSKSSSRASREKINREARHRLTKAPAPIIPSYWVIWSWDTSLILLRRWTTSLHFHPSVHKHESICIIISKKQGWSRERAFRGGSCHKILTRLLGMFPFQGCRWLISLKSDCSGVCLFSNRCARRRAHNLDCSNGINECEWL